MVENPRKEIMVDPMGNWSILEDGFGYRVKCTKMILGKDEEGREIVTCIIEPESKVRKHYDFRIGEEVDEETLSMELTVLKIDLIPVNIWDDSNRVWMYAKSFRHEETEISKREKNLKIQLEAKDRTIATQDAEILRANEKLNLMKTNPAEAFKDGYQIAKLAGELAESFGPKKKEND